MFHTVATSSLRFSSSGKSAASLLATSNHHMPSLYAQQRRRIHTHRTIFQLYQELASWKADWPLRPPPGPEEQRTDGGGSSSSGGGGGSGESSNSKIRGVGGPIRHLDTSPDRWSPLLVTEFISEAITLQSATDRRGRTVHPSAFIQDLPWSFFSASRLATVPRLQHFSGLVPPHTNDAVSVDPFMKRTARNQRDSQSPSASSSSSSISAPIDPYPASPMVLMFHGSPFGIDILKRGARFMHNCDDAQGIYMTPSLASARGYADIRRVDINWRNAKNNGNNNNSDTASSKRVSSSLLTKGANISADLDDDAWAHRSISSISAAALRQRAVLVCFVSLGKVYHRYAQTDPEAEALIARGEWAIEGSAVSDAAANAAATRTRESQMAAAMQCSSAANARHGRNIDAHYDYAGYSPPAFSSPLLSGGGSGNGLYANTAANMMRGGGGGYGSSTSWRNTNGRNARFYDPNEDPTRPYDSYVDFVDGEQVYCIRNPDKIIPVVALAINKQAGL